MGICSSLESTSVATVKLILQDGQLQEFSYPVKVSHVLQTNPTCFVCDSDDMDFDDFVSAINGEEDLQLGQLYFVLPLTWLAHPLQAEKMAALAIKASLALRGNDEGRCGCSRRRKVVDPVVFSGRRDAVSSCRKVVEKRRGRSEDGGGGGRGGGGAERPNFVTKLSVILEE